MVSVDTQVGGSMVAGQTNGMTSELTTDTRTDVDSSVKPAETLN